MMKPAGHHFYRVTGVLFVASLVGAQQSSAVCTTSSSCPQSTNPSSYTSCCGNVGCCTPQAHLAWLNATAGLSGTCLAGYNKVFGSCIARAVECINSGAATGGTACFKQVIQSCVATQPCATQSATCNMSMAMLFKPLPISLSECVPQSCLKTGQLTQAARNLYKLLCSTYRDDFCPLTSVQLQCPGKIAVYCMKKGAVACKQVTSSGNSWSSKPTSAPSSTCSFNGKTHICPQRQNSANTACCSVGGRFLGCCRPDVQTFLADLFSNFGQTCGSDLASVDFSCYKKLVTCQDQLVTAFEGSSSRQLSIQNLTSLVTCNLVSDCINSSITAQSNCSSTQRLCKVSYNSVVPFLTKSLAQSGYMCLPKSCTGNDQQVMGLGKVICTSMCYPVCALTGSFKRLTLPQINLPSIPGLLSLQSVVKSLQSTGCFVKSVTVSCSGDNPSTYSPSGAECPDINILPIGKPSSGSNSQDGTSKDGSSSGTSKGSSSDGKDGYGKEHSENNDSSNNTLIFVMAAIGGALIITAIILGVVFYRRRQLSHMDTPQTYSALQEDSLQEEES